MIPERITTLATYVVELASAGKTSFRREDAMDALVVNLNLSTRSLASSGEPRQIRHPFERLRLLLVVQLNEVQNRPHEILDGIEMPRR